MQHSKVLVPFFCHQEFALDPVHYLSNVSTGMNIAVRSIPENGQKPTPCTLFPLEIIAKLNDVILKSVQLQISGANNSDVGELGYSCTARQDQGPFLLACSASSTTESISLQGELLRCERQPQHSDCAQQHGAGNPCNGRGFIKVPILLVLIRTVWLRTFLVGATSATNDHPRNTSCGSLVGNPILFYWQGPFELRSTHQTTKFLFKRGR